MSAPERSADTERGVGQWDVAILCPFASMNVNHHPLAVDVADLQIDRFADSQPQGIGDPQEALQAKRAGGVNHLKDLVLGDDFGKCDDARDLGLLEDFPISGAGGSVEELDGRKDDALGARSGFDVNDLVQEVNADVVLGEFLRRRFVEIGEMAYFPDVTVDGPFLHSRETEVIDKFVEPFSLEARRGFW